MSRTSLLFVLVSTALAAGCGEGATGGLEIIRVADGLVIPIPTTSDLTQPTWRP